ncbi:EcsC family protein [Leptolyngbya ohadii]|uniref:EcsC family protein n=1 Tax=Leptolyngbya ohadii TaxID=1962290 RepID=UPI00117BB233|nr:EcsC family protein [Leptolyngbya ohadii]
MSEQQSHSTLTPERSPLQKAENPSFSAKSSTSTTPQTSGRLTWVRGLAGGAIDRSKEAVKTAVTVGGAATRRAVGWVSGLTEGTGRALNLLGRIPLLRNPLMRRLVGVFKLDWLLGISDRVDTRKAEVVVKEMQQKYPTESPSQISHRLMVRKSMQAGSSGFVTSLLPGFATALLALDLAATTALQTELVYEIAAAYGLDLNDPERKGEVLGIFGLALGGGNAIKAGLGFLRNVPFAGALIGASTNATVLYSVGYAASRFYEARLQSGTQEPSTETLQSIQQESEEYLNKAIAQQAIMDQITVHMILASYPDKTWDDILPELQRLQIEANSLQTIAANIRSPQPLDPLLNQLDRDFAVAVLAQCRRLAESNGTVSPQEAAILQQIEQRCDALVVQ